MSRAVLVDTTLCTGCRGCQVACKEQNDLPAEKTKFFALAGGFQNPPALSPKTLSLVTFWELDRKGQVPVRTFVRRQCMHCLDPRCVKACPVGALTKNADGSVTHDAANCIGCLSCKDSCPFGVPSIEIVNEVPHIRKCEFCTSRVADPSVPDVLNKGHSTEDVLDEPKRKRLVAARSKPACVAACATGALVHGDRDELLAEARRRIRRAPARYQNHVWGEREAGGTSWLYLASVPFDQIGLPTKLPPAPAEDALNEVAGVLAAPELAGVGAVLGGLGWLSRRREEVAAADRKGEDGPGKDR
jgi:formate dehydrogenase iron-sulfur subunit